jgi:XRE family transcriptional regulator, master regulator for biofilm formation
MDDRSWQTLGERIHMIRRRRGLTSKELAARVGTGRTTISRLENNSKPAVSLDVVVRIAQVLEISLDYLTGRKDDESVELEPTAVA